MNNRSKNFLLICGSIGFTIFTIETLSLIARKIIECSIPYVCPKNLVSIHTPNQQANSTQEIEKFPFLTHREFRLSRPEPYRNSMYFDWFIEEGWTRKDPECNSQTSHDGKGFNLKQSDTHNCKGETILNGWRITTDQPKNSSKNVYIYGGSTVQNSEVPNNHTIASYLQRSLLRHGINYKVHNRGFTTVVTSQQLEFLRKEKLKKGDIVIFYDGGNNQWQGVANNSPNGTIIGMNRNLVFFYRLKGLASKSQMYKLLDLIQSKSSGPFDCTILNESDLYKRANKSFDAYKSDLISANIYAEKSGAKFVHFMQPHLFSIGRRGRHSKYEQKLLNTMPSDMIPMCADKYLEVAAKLYSERHLELKNSGIQSYDISRMFEASDPRRPAGEHYLDWIDITENGNKSVAKEISKTLILKNFN